MPQEKTIKRAQEDKREGKSPSTQASEFVREEIHHVRQGKHGARSARQAVAIGLSKARRAGVKLQKPAKGKNSARTRRKAKQDSARSRKRRKPSTRRSRATKSVVKREGRKAASSRSLSRQARSASRSRSKKSRIAAAKKAAKTRAARRHHR
jgi:hypothetical protein